MRKRSAGSCALEGVDIRGTGQVRHSNEHRSTGSGVAVAVSHGGTGVRAARHVNSKRIGHTDVGVTLKVHAHVLPGDDEAAAASVATFIGI